MTKRSFKASFASFAKFLARLRSDRSGNVLMIFGFAVIPLTFVVGFGVDYGRAMRLQTQLNAAADAAALAAVSPSMILQQPETSVAAATNMFNSQAARLNGYENLSMMPDVTEGSSTGTGSLGYLRKATVSYTAESVNLFGGILGARTLTVSGVASASAAQPPNVDFYLAMDNSPSMLLPATSDGISKIMAATATPQLPDGCAFACHAKLPHSDKIYVNDKDNRQILLSNNNPGAYYRWDKHNRRLYDSSGNSMNSYETTYSITDSSNGPVTITVNRRNTYDTGYWADGYWLTHNYGEIYGSPSRIVLRKDDVVSAASQLIPFAADQADQYQVTYRMQMFSFDWTRSGQSSPVRRLTNLTDVSTYSSSFSVESIFPPDDYWWKNNEPSKDYSIDDRATETLNMLRAMKNTVPSAGTGAPGATPQKIFFLITDGMIDQPNGGGRYFGPLRETELAECTAIKAKGIKIAILYTQYLPESLVGDAWSQSNVAPFLPVPPSPYPAGNAGSSDEVFTALERCASPGSNGTPLVETVTADDSISTALQELFSTALQSARLVK